MFSSIANFFTSKVLVGIIGILLGAIILLGVDNYFTSSSLDDTKEKLTIKELEVEQKDKAIESIIEGYNTAFEIERAMATEKAITMEQKQEVIKTTSKVQAAVIKRGEIKQDEKSNFTIVNF